MKKKCILRFSKWGTIVSIVVLLNSSCGRKHGSAYCFSCEKGKLYYSRGCEAYPMFVKDDGDSILLIGNLAKKFHKEGVSVCVRFKKETSISSGGCGPHEVKCINKLN